jgi:phosphoglycolate phosphatase-like HAD superfamily hydrolase
MRPTILLFDVDGTLVTTGGAGRRALERTFERVHGRRDACAFPLDGMTDRAIVRAGLITIGMPAGEKEIDEVLAGYIEVLSEEVAGIDSKQYRLHAGIQEALDAAGGRASVAIGLGTGNIREGARVKLNRVGIYERFKFGGFGCDSEQRVELVQCGAQRGADHLGRPLEACRVVVIGDTPKDVAAAQAIGAESVAVATGRFSVAELKSAGATHAFLNLAAPGAVEALLGP